MITAQTLRFIIFCSILCALIIFETIRPMEKRSFKNRIKHISYNLLISAVNSVLLAYLSLKLNLQLKHWAWIFPHLIFLDLWIYLQHRLFHKIPFFWHYHQFHHSDQFLDCSSGIRFHPLEMFFSWVWKFILIVSLQIPYESILFFDIIISSASIFNHANIKLPKKLDSFLQFIIVTPNMHWIHHFKDRKYYNSNFGFFLSVWDHLFKSYKKITSFDFTSSCMGLKNWSEKDQYNWKKIILPP